MFNLNKESTKLSEDRFSTVFNKYELEYSGVSRT
jgi:hypothetical protein